MGGGDIRPASIKIFLPLLRITSAEPLVTSSLTFNLYLTFKVIEVSFELSRERPVDAKLIRLGSLSASTLGNATYLVDVLSDAAGPTPALIVVGLSGGTIIRLSWYWVIVV
jgi:hypothetical protein